MKHVTKLFILVISFAIHLVGLLQLVDYVSMNGLLGTSVSSFLVSYGITQIVLASILIFVSMLIFALLFILLLQELKVKTTTPEIQKISRSYVKFQKFVQGMEKDYGLNWMEDQKAVASAISANKKK